LSIPALSIDIEWTFRGGNNMAKAAKKKVSKKTSKKTAKKTGKKTAKR
jgi:hypothetical protein